jgi:hypothetical protein
MNKKILKYTCIVLFAVYFHTASFAYAETENSQSLSVTPPLFQLSAVPGDIWQSSIKVVNGNSYPLTIYTEVVNFTATGETGQGKFTPIFTDNNEKSTLANWINISNAPRTIPPEHTEEISFFVEVPKNAPPGGHYAAILVSTEQPKEGSEKLAVTTSQTVTSLFFVRIEGDVHEEATIREFRATDSLVPTTNAEFSLRFENKGNVHLQPRGNIIITNMWGTERGVIPVNYQTQYGNVLPSSIRDFKFSWNSEFRISDVGRYKAEATLAYGANGIQSTAATAYFWVIPVKATLVTLAVIVGFIWLIIFIIKLYIRRMLALAGVDVEHVTPPHTENIGANQKVLGVKAISLSYKKVAAPLRVGVLDLRKELSRSEENADLLKSLIRFVIQYKLFFISLAILIGIFVITALYFGNVTNKNMEYKVIIDEGDSKTVLESPDIKNK